MPRKKSNIEVEYAEEVTADERIKRKSRERPKKKDPTAEAANSSSNNNNKSNTTTKQKKKPIKHLREKRRQQSALASIEEKKRKKLKVEAGIEDHPGNIIAEAATTDRLDNTNNESAAAEISDFYWEVESVCGRRIHKGRVEYLIRWKGCKEEENTWEPAVNLCDTAMEEAMRYVKAQKLKEKRREEDEKKLFGDSDNSGDVVDVDNDKEEGGAKSVNNENGEKKKVAVKEDAEMESAEDIVEDTRWDWTDSGQVVFHPVQRINIHDADAPSLVKEARVNGTPIVLVGHVGWANFAKRWISKKDDKADKKEVDAATADAEEKVAAVDVRNGGANSDEAEAKDVATAPIEHSNAQNGETAPTINGNSDSATAGEAGLNGGVNGGDAGSGSGAVINEAAAAPQSSIGNIEGNNLNSNGAVNGEAVKPVADFASGIAESIPNASEQEENGETAKPVVDTSDGTAATTVDELKDEGIEKVSLKPTDDVGDSLLDLSRRDYYLDIKKMIDDIGEEDVPVIKRNYNEEKPIHGNIRAAKFLTNCWPSEDSDAEASKKSPKLYLHQWQFPLSESAGHKLCHKNNPLPKSIMGEDLLKYWLDLSQCKLDSPLQYIFMGREDTLSKLHRDPGGLDISIAPIVGEKECVLAHRADGSDCLYHLQANINDVDLHQYPLLSQAKLWRTTIQPGEILLMPYGTYHQCRNITPCLSYSRFHLDTVNLLPFVQSMVNGDAPEIDHEEILWNLTTELISKVDAAFDHTQSLLKDNLSTDDDISEDMVESVNILRMLRHFAREVARRKEIKQQLKGEEEQSDHCFSTLVDDVDMCLHEFRFRKMRAPPPFKARQGKALKNTIAKGGRKDVIATDLSKYEMGGKPVVAFNTVLEVNYMSLKRAEVDKLYPHASKKKVGEKLIGSLAVGDMVNVQLHQKVVKAEVLELVSQSYAYISFEDYPLIYDEWLPAHLLRTPDRAEISPVDLKPGLVVVDLSNSNEYRAKVLSTQNGLMAKMRLYVSQHVMDRWVSADMILGKYEPPVKQVKEKRQYTVLEVVEEAKPVCYPKSGQVVEVHRKGAAWVIKCHYSELKEGQTDPVPTHVDVRYILGSSTEEKMVPIGLVRLAPELDPDSGRSHREREQRATTNNNS